MKKLLTALLILICFSCGDEHDKNYPRNDTTQKEREHDETLDVVSDWAYDKCTEYFDKSIFLANASGNRDSINKYNYLGKAMREVHTKVLSLKYRNKKHESLPKPSPLPDTTKPEPMQNNDTGWMSWDSFKRRIDTSYFNQKKDTTKPLKIKMQPRWRDSVAIGEGLTVYGTDKVSLGGTLEYNTTIDRSEFENDTTKCLLLVSDTSNQNGFRSSRCFWMYGYRVRGEDILEEWGEYIYLDDRLLPLPKNIVVWMSKELK